MKAVPNTPRQTTIIHGSSGRSRTNTPAELQAIAENTTSAMPFRWLTRALPRLVAVTGAREVEWQDYLCGGRRQQPRLVVRPAATKPALANWSLDVLPFSRLVTLANLADLDDKIEALERRDDPLNRKRDGILNRPYISIALRKAHLSAERSRNGAAQLTAQQGQQAILALNLDIDHVGFPLHRPTVFRKRSPACPRP